MKMSREGSRIGKHDRYYSDEQLEYVDLSNTSVLPKRPKNHRSSVYNSECDASLPELSETQHSRQSLPHDNLNDARISMDLESTTD